ncbi:hypothetical protein MSAN_00572300 [Mycena sanguinolenta]|uniref:Uncharacterized protein n=1 Tax=Mycena sanguinolenta TaxID=230812 RepID=A0A8H6Z9V1_9AGAR|nr:hypothetical protein MSAN_00572300 [Mycena sanguinolenta]
MNATEAVVQNADYHARLLAQISELDYVPPALEQQNSYIASLEKDSVTLARRITELEKKTKKERKEHESIRDSTARRFAAKITGRKEKFEAKASKEEREYIEALEQEMQHKQQQETLETMITEAKAVRADLQDKLASHNKLKADLAALYSRIFDGPTQAYLEDDVLEYQLQQVQGRYNEIQGYLNRESQAVSLLQSASSVMQECMRDMNQALSYSQWDIYGGGTMSDMMERNALSSAELRASQAQVFVQQARVASPQVQLIGNITIAHGSIISDVIFDNIFTDLAFHDKIKDSARNVEAVQFNLNRELNAARSRAGAIGADLNAAADALAQARGALDAFRRSVFDRLSGGGSGPPAYDPQSEAPVTMPRAPGDPASNYTPPPGPPPSSGSSYAPPPGPPPPSSSTSYAPPPGPPPPQIQQPETSSYSPPAGPPPGGSRAASPSAWGSRNPFAAAALKGESPAGGATPEKS